MTASEIVANLEQVLGLTGAPRRIKAIIEEQLIIAFNYLPPEAAELADRRAVSVTRMIAERQQASLDSGTIYTLALVGTSLDAVAGSCCPLPSDGPEIVRLKNQRIVAGEILQAMRDLDFNQFETFGARVLKELGTTNTQVTRQSNDQGIDFYGELSLGSFTTVPAPFLKLAHDVRFALVGQAKHYPTRSLGPDIVRELVGAMTLARTKTFSRQGLNALDKIALKPFSPVLALLFTTGDFTSGASHLALEAGIIARNGMQLAVFLADKGVGIVDDGNRRVFRIGEFEQWLSA